MSGADDSTPNSGNGSLDPEETPKKEDGLKHSSNLGTIEESRSVLNEFWR